MSSQEYIQDIEEIHRNQEMLIESLEKEQQNYPEDRTAVVDKILTRARDYHGKLVNIKKSLVTINERTASLKRKANKILEAKEKAEVEERKMRERQELLERHLEPVVNTKRNSSGH